MRRSIKAMKRIYAQRCITSLVMLAVFFAVFQPVLPQCSMDAKMLAAGMMSGGDCAMSDAEDNTITSENANDCADCPIAFCFPSASSAQLSGSTLSLTEVFNFVPLAMVSETILTGRTLTPPGHPPKV